jgi:hypothetical protein
MGDYEFDDFDFTEQAQILSSPKRLKNYKWLAEGEPMVKPVIVKPWQQL